MELLKEIEKIHNNIQAKNYQFAIEKCNKLIKKFPNNAYLYNLGGLALQQHQYIKASLNYFQKAIELDPQNIAAKNNLANSYKVLGKFDISEKLYKEVLIMNPNYLKSINNYANLKQSFNDYENAIDLYKKALKVDPKNITVLLSLAGSYHSLGKFSEAEKILNQIIKINPHLMSAHKMLSSLTEYKVDNGHLKFMLELTKNNDLSNSQKTDLFFALGKAHDDTQEYDKAFKFFDSANKLRKSTTNFNITEEEKLFKKIHNIFQDVDLTNNIKNNNKKKIIFICGMPRSGTTLVEQILASHSSVTGAGELVYLQQSIKNNFYKDNSLDHVSLNQDIFAERTKIASDYFEMIQHHKIETKIFSDKAPSNFRWIGIIKLFFPNSKIIHCKRNPKDVCLSLFKNGFASKELDWCYSQDDIAKYYNMYSKLMDFWHNKIGDFIYDLDYEKLVKDKDNEIKKVLDFCSLTHEDECFNHHKSKKTPIKTVSISQARKPIYTTSVNKNELYEKNLNRMFSLLN